MPTGQHPFIDIAVHEQVRTHFAVGDPAVVLSPSLAEVLWANGAGVRLFGHSGLYDFIDAGLDRSSASFRQIATAAHAIRDTPDRPSQNFVMRTGSGFRRPVMPATLERMHLTDGSQALLLTAAAAEPADNSEKQAACIIDGFAEMETNAAVLDGDGTVLSATPSFERLKLAAAERGRLVGDAADEADRLIKRPVPTALGLLPAAVARITDMLYLLIAVEMPVDAPPPRDKHGTAPGHGVETADGGAGASSPAPSILSLAPTRRTVDATPLTAQPPARAADEPTQPTDPGRPFAFDRARRPVRFVWKIDRAGLFSDVSPEFAETVGPNAADITGRSFSDVAQVFNLDPDHAIADLLHRRDTWSGKTVLWPVQGTDLRVPVDLAALPTYSRDREFDGFRGFGIVRSGDAEIDPERIGLALVANADSTGATLFDRPAARPRAPLNDVRQSATDNVPSPPTDTTDQADAPETAAASDKVIRLEERRGRPRDGLTATEKQAFREIAMRLGQKRDDAEDAPSVPADGPATAATGSQNPPDAAAVTAGGGPAPAGPPAERKRLTAGILDLLPIPVAVHDGSTVFRINDEFRLLTGYLSATHLNEAGSLKALFGDDDTTPANESGRLTLHLADGKTVSARARLRSVDWEDGHALMLALTDVEHPAAEDTEPAVAPDADGQRIALQVEVEELRSILETATDGVVLLDDDGLIRSMNRSAAALFDYDDNETRDRPFAMLFAHESQRTVQDYLTSLTDSGVASVLNDGREVIGREASGGLLPLFMTIGHLPGSNGYCAVMRDITQWKRAEQDLRAAKREAETASSHKSAFLARVSHEIRTPLNAIIGFADLMAEERFGPIGGPRYVDYARDIGRSGRHVLDIVNDLLDISKIEAGEQEMDFEPVSLNRTLLDAASILQPQANNRRVILRTSLSSSVPEIIVDRRSLKQIAINLLSNAIRFTEAGGHVVVSTAYEPNGAVSLRIRDTGVGMTRDELEQAMKPFRQVDGPGRERGEGTGLGLPLAKAMAEANRAQFAMNSQRGQGTLVEIVFPAQHVRAE